MVCDDFLDNPGNYITQADRMVLTDVLEIVLFWYNYDVGHIHLAQVSSRF